MHYAAIPTYPAMPGAYPSAQRSLSIALNVKDGMCPTDTYAANRRTDATQNTNSYPLTQDTALNRSLRMPEHTAEVIRSRKEQIVKTLLIPSDLIHYVSKRDIYHLAQVFPEASGTLLNGAFHRLQIARLLRVNENWLTGRLKTSQRDDKDTSMLNRHYLAHMHRACNQIPAHTHGERTSVGMRPDTKHFLQSVVPEIYAEWCANDIALMRFNEESKHDTYRLFFTVFEGVATTFLIYALASNLMRASLFPIEEFLVYDPQPSIMTHDWVRFHSARLNTLLCHYATPAGYMGSYRVIHHIVTGQQLLRLHVIWNDMDESWRNIRAAWNTYADFLNANALMSVAYAVNPASA
jgi:hypothetical protein